jgi:ABC-type glycerol-3-phosphate transport system substrate-binding protein
MKRFIAILLILVLVAAGGFTAYRFLKPREFRVDPRAKINPERDYSLRLWISRPSIPDLSLFVEGAEEIVAHFTEANPHMGVDLYLIPSELFNVKLADAISAGDPPDIALNLGSNQAYYGQLQVPMGLYMSKEERAAWPTGVLGQVTTESQVWGQPVAGLPTVLMGNLTLLEAVAVDREQIVESGWNWEQFLATVKAAAGSKTYGLVLTNTGEPLVRSLAVSVGKPSPQGGQPELQWTAEDLETMAGLWLQLKNAEGVPAANKLTEDCLGAFLRGDAAMIGPLNSFLATWLWDEAVKQGVTPTLLPVPSHVQPPAADLAVIPLVLFRQEDYQGHDHTAAGAFLGRYLAMELGPVLSRHLGAVPLRATGQADLAALSFDEVSAKAYAPLERVMARPYMHGPTPGLTLRQWEEAVYPYWQELVAGKITPQQFSLSVLQSLSSMAGES